MATTTNFGWDTPDDTDYVTDGAAAMRELGQDIDTTLVDLKGGTTGQILSKASNTDMDFTWASPNPGDITAVTAGTGISGGGTSGDVTITNSMATAIDAKGDLIAGTGADAFSRLAVGTNGQILTADSTAATGLAWATPASTGGMTLLSTTTLSGASTTISSISQSYTNLQVVLENVTVSTAAEVSFRIVNSSTLHFQYFFNAQSTTPGQISNGSGSLTGLATMDNAASGGMGNWIIDFYNYAAGKRFGYSGQGIFYKPSWCGYWFGGGFESTTPLSSLTIVASAGNLAGTCKIYGVK